MRSPGKVLNELYKRQYVFGIPLRFLTHKEIGEFYTEDDAHGTVNFKKFLENKFHEISFYMPPNLMLAFLLRRASSDSPHAIRMQTDEQIENLARCDNPPPVGLIVCQGASDNVGDVFLNNFTKAPYETFSGFTASNDEWRLMQICHELGHGLEENELKTDIAGMLCYCTLTGNEDFLFNWHHARLLQSIFNQDDSINAFKASMAALFIHEEAKEGKYSGLNLDDRSTQEEVKRIEGQIELNEEAFYAVKQKFLNSLGENQRYLSLADLCDRAEEIYNNSSSPNEKDISTRIYVCLLLLKANCENNYDYGRRRDYGP